MLIDSGRSLTTLLDSSRSSTRIDASLSATRVASRLSSTPVSRALLTQSRARCACPTPSQAGPEQGLAWPGPLLSRPGYRRDQADRRERRSPAGPAGPAGPAANLPAPPQLCCMSRLASGAVPADTLSRQTAACHHLGILHCRRRRRPRCPAAIPACPRRAATLRSPRRARCSPAPGKSAAAGAAHPPPGAPRRSSCPPPAHPSRPTLVPHGAGVPAREPGTLLRRRRLCRSLHVAGRAAAACCRLRASRWRLRGVPGPLHLSRAAGRRPRALVEAGRPLRLAESTSF